MNDRDRQAEQRCGALGDLLAEAFPAEAPATDARLLRQLERALRAEPAAAPPARRTLLAPALSFACALLAAGAIFSYARRPISYEIHGASTDGHGRFVAPAGHSVGVRFSEGTSITVLPESAARIVARTRAGATFMLERGRASFAVVHRPDARWLVEAGPFQIDVTGTRFDVRWSGEPGGGLEVALYQGSVTVRGSLAGGGIPLVAGQRLVAHPDHHDLSVLTGDAGAALPDPAPPVATAAPLARAPSIVTVTGHHPRRTVASVDLRRPAPAPAAAPPAPSAAEAAPAPPAPTGEPPPAETVRDPRRLLETRRPPPALDPPRVRAPRQDPDVPIRAGGELCAMAPPQFTFESSPEEFYSTEYYVTAFKNPSLDRSHSWCGDGSLRLDADFNMRGRPNETGRASFVGILPSQVGEVGVRLPAPVDLTERTVTVHVYVDAPSYVRFAARVFVSNLGTWVPSRYEADMTPGRWWTIRHTFRSDSSVRAVNHVDKITFQIYAVSPERVWTGSVYVDDFGWR